MSSSNAARIQGAGPNQGDGDPIDTRVINSPSVNQGSPPWKVQGSNPDGQPSTDNPVLIGGTDGGGTRRQWFVSPLGSGRVAEFNEHVDNPLKFFVSTFLKGGSGATPQNLFTLEMANGSTTSLRIKRICVSVSNATVLTTFDPSLAWGRTTALPTAGTALTLVNADTNRPVSANITARGANASDGGVATAITATLAAKAGSAFVGRPHTLVGQMGVGLIELYKASEDGSVEQFVLKANEGMVVQVASGGAGNSTGYGYLVFVEAEEFTPV